MTQKWLQVVVLSLATISVSSASVYVVDSVTGNDNNSGLLQSGSNPWSQAKKTITSAINAASSGDDVWVAGGQFSFGTEVMPLPLAGKQLFIGGGFKVGDSSRSQAKPAVVTTEVISPLTFLDLQSGQENQSTFDGLRFIYSPVNSGGAISTLFKIIGGATQFSRCWFSNLNTGANGPAVFIADGGSPKLVQNVFLSCSADQPANGVFEFINVSAADVHSNLFADSSSLNPFRSLMYVKGTAKITNNSFFYSSMPAINLDSSTAVLANNLFIGSQILSLGTWVVQTPSSIVTAGHNAFQYQLHATFPANSPYSTLATAAGDLFVTNDAGVVQPSGSWAAPPNFHLKANSVCINKAAPSQVLHPLDLDGQSRALGLFNLGNEIGCDEVWTSLADIMFAGNVYSYDTLPIRSIPFVDVTVETMDGTPPSTKRVAVSTQGDFETHFELAPGIYSVRVKAPLHLSSTRRDLLIGDDSVDGLRMLIQPGDANGDDTVNTDDYLILSTAFDTMPGETHWDDRADFDFNGIINVDDYLLLNAGFDELPEDY